MAAGEAEASNPAPPIPDLTGVRFFAALGVLIGHYVDPWGLHGRAASVLVHGTSGVGLFFVLSGVILTYVYGPRLTADRVSMAAVRRYARARFARVYPIHAISLIAIAPIVLGLLAAGAAPPFAPGFGQLTSLRVASSFAANLVLLQAYWPGDWRFQQMWNAPAWSIGCEAFFYAVFPLFLWTVVRPLRGKPFALLVVGGSLLLVELAAFHAGTAFDQTRVPFWNRLPYVRLWEFLAGVAVGSILFLNDGPVPRLLRQRRARHVLLGLGLSLLAVLALRGFSPLDLVAQTSAFVAVIASLGSGRTVLSPLLAHPWMVLLGEASYCLYMIQWLPLLVLLSVRPPIWVSATAFLFTIAVSIPVHLWIEAPMRRWLTSTPGSRRLLVEPVAPNPTSAPQPPDTASLPTIGS